MSAGIVSPATTPWARLRPSDRRALVAGAAVVVAMLTYSGIIRPALAGLQSERQVLEERRGLLDRERALLATAPQLPRVEQETRRILAAEAPRLFMGDSVAATAELNTYVSQLATAAGVRLSSVEGRPVAVDRGLMRLSVELRGEGTWRQVMTYARSLEASTRLVQVANVRIERGARGGPLGGAMISMSATLVGYADGVR